MSSDVVAGEAWHLLSAKAVLTSLKSSNEGLSADEAARRLVANGPNELKQARRVSAMKASVPPGLFVAGDVNIRTSE